MTRDDLLLTFVDRVEKVWIRLGVAPTARRRLVLQLEADLAAAHNAGASVADLVSADPVAFAVELAQSEDVVLMAPPPEPTRQAVILTAILGGIAGAAFAWVFIETGPVGDLVFGQGPGLREKYAWIPLQTLAVLVTLTGIAGSVWWRFRAAPGVRNLALRTTSLAAVGGVVAFMPLVGFAWATDYSTSAYSLVLGSVVAAAILGATIRLGLSRHPTRSRV